MNKIPHIYHNTIYSRKLFEIMNEKYVTLIPYYQKLYGFNDISKLEGILLDVKGENIGIRREGRTDEDYRQVLKFEYMRTTKWGSYQDMVDILTQYFKTENIEIRELSGKIQLISNISEKLLEKKVKALKAAGVGILISNEVYIAQYTLEELALLDLNEISNIKLKEE